MAIVVSEYDCPDGTDGRLGFYLKLDTWTPDEFAALAAGVDPSSILWCEDNRSWKKAKKLSGATLTLPATGNLKHEAAHYSRDSEFEVIDDEIVFLAVEDETEIPESALDQIFQQFQDIRRVFKNSTIHEAGISPAAWIRHAATKNITLHWLPFAIRRGLIANVGRDSTTLERSRIEENSPNRKSETAATNIIGVLLALLLDEKDSKGIPYSKFRSQGQLIDTIHDLFGDRDGLSQSNLEKQFAKSKQAIARKRGDR